MVLRNSKIHKLTSSFLLIHARYGLEAWIGWSVRIWMSQIIFCVSFSRTDCALRIYYLLILLNFSLFHNSKWIASPTQSCILLYSFRASLLHSLVTYTYKSLGFYQFFFDFVLCCYWKSCSFSLQFSSSYPHPGVLVYNFLIYHLKYPYIYFSSHFCFLDFFLLLFLSFSLDYFCLWDIEALFDSCQCSNGSCTLTEWT